MSSSSAGTTPAPARGSLAILALSVFAVAATEFAGIGLQRSVGPDLGVSPGTAGLVVTAYALGCALLGPPLVLLCAGRDRRTLLAAVMTLLAAAQVLAALAPSFGMLIAARALAGVLQGIFFGVATVTAVGLAPPGREGRALAAVSLGLTAALVAGAPIANALADALDWRAVFWALAAISAAGAAGLAVAVPRGPASAAGVGEQLAVLRQPAVRRAVGLTVVALPGVFCTYTYLPALLDQVTGLPGSGVTLGLALLGLAALVGTTLGGRLLDASDSRAGMRVAFAGLAAAFALLAAGAGSAPIALAACGAVGLTAFVFPPVLQGRVIAAAGAAPLLAAALNISAFNIANAVGAGVGGALVDADAGLRAPATVSAIAAGLVTIGLLLAARPEPCPQPSG